MASKLVNGLMVVHIETGIEVEITINSKEMQLALDEGLQMNDSWELMNASVVSRGEMNIIGDIDVSDIVIGGVAKVFH